jgi:hypothetical protein
MRKTLPQYILSFMKDIGATQIFGNIEYEIDEIRRDIKVCELTTEQQTAATFVHDRPVVKPDTFFTKQNKPYTVCYLGLCLVLAHFKLHFVGVLALAAPLACDDQHGCRRLYQ